MGPFFIVLACTWIALSATALLFLREYPQSHWIMTAALPAFLIEAIFYIGSLFQETRERFDRIQSSRNKATLLWVSALIPYLIFSSRAGTFIKNGFDVVALLTGVLAFWYVLLPKRWAYDFGFLVIAAAPVISRLFQRVYQSPDPHIRVDILGHLMWIRLGVAALLIFRKWDPGAFGLWPRLTEWRSGVLYYLVALVPIVTIALLLHDVRFDPQHGPWWRVAGIGIGTFFGMLWVVALGEELFFRGVVEKTLLNGLSSPLIAILVSSVLFGSAHLWFHQFPDWKQATVATVLGVACGIGYWRSGSVRVPMVTHACVVATWRVFFK